MTGDFSELKSWLDAGLNFFYPPICYLCKTERATAAEGFVCAFCWSRREGVRFIRPPFCERCGLPYDGSITTKFECSIAGKWICIFARRVRRLSPPT